MRVMDASNGSAALPVTLVFDVVGRVSKEQRVGEVYEHLVI